MSVMTDEQKEKLIVLYGLISNIVKEFFLIAMIGSLTKSRAHEWAASLRRAAAHLEELGDQL